MPNSLSAPRPRHSLHCPEMGVAFWAVWYVLGMAVPAIIGALLGPRLLRW